MDTIVVTKRCAKGHEKTQGMNGRWHCTPCARARRANGGSSPRPAPLPPDAPRNCAKGHAKMMRRDGSWVCRTCQAINHERRNADARERIGKPREPERHQPSEVLTKTCVYGHRMVRRGSGVIACNECRRVRKKGTDALRQEGTCSHTSEPGFAALISRDSRVVCLQCIVEHANRSVRTTGRVG